MDARIEKILVCLGIFLFCFSAQAQTTEVGKQIRLIASVTDERERYAGSLKAEDVQIFVDKKLQEIISFGENNEPATIVFLIDLSGESGGKSRTFGIGNQAIH